MLFVLSASSSFAAPKSEWILVQRHYKFGDSELRLSADAVKIVDKTAGYTVVSRSPNWQVVAFRNDDKVLCKMPFAQFYAGQNFRGLPSKMYGFTGVGSQIVSGMKCRVFQSAREDLFTVNLPGIGVKVEELLIAYYDVRPFEGIALKLVRRNRVIPGEKTRLFTHPLSPTEVALETSQIRQIRYDEADFAIPRNYRETTDFQQVRTSAARRKEGEEIILDLGVGEKLGGGARK